MDKILQFKIVLIESNPMIWRRFRVTDNYRMDRFHQVLQIVMGWNNSHLHEFRIKGREIGMIDPDYVFAFPLLEEETSVFLRDFDLKEKDTFTRNGRNMSKMLVQPARSTQSPNFQLTCHSITKKFLLKWLKPLIII